MHIYSGFVVALGLIAVSCSHAPAKHKSSEELLQDFSSPDDSVRARALAQLAAGNGPEVEMALTMGLEDDSVLVKRAAIGALRRSDHRNLKDPLWAAAQKHAPGEALRTEIGFALAHQQDPRGIGLLLEGRFAPSPDVTQALLEVGTAGIPQLIQELHRPEIRDAVSTALVNLGSPAVEPLIDVMHNDYDKYTRFAAAAVLGEIADDKATDALMQAFQDSDPQFIAATYRFLIRRGEPNTEKPLINALDMYGSLEMAQDFIRCGNPALKAPAESWIAARFPTSAPLDPPSAFWGGTDPRIKRLMLIHFDGSLTSVSGIAPVGSRNVSFVPGRWGSAILVQNGGLLEYPLTGNLNFQEGTIEMWVAPMKDGTDPIYRTNNHVLLLYSGMKGDMFFIAQASRGGLFSGTLVQQQFSGVARGNFADWKAGAWHHLAFTYSAASHQQHLYLDGVATGLGGRTAMAVPSLGAHTFTVGSDSTGNGEAFAIDELQTFYGEKAPDSIRVDAHKRQPAS